MKRNAQAISKLVKSVDLIATSPLVRAAQTADILKSHYRGATVIEEPCLKPDQPPESFLKWLKGQKRYSVIAIVGHEPHLSQLCGYLVSGEARSLIELKKGGLCVIDFYDKVDKGRGVFVYLAGPILFEKLMG